MKELIEISSDNNVEQQEINSQLNNNNNNFSQSQFQATQLNQTGKEIEGEREGENEVSVSFGDSYLDNVLAPIPTINNQTSTPEVLSPTFIIEKSILFTDDSIVVEESVFQSSMEIESMTGDLGESITMEEQEEQEQEQEQEEQQKSEIEDSIIDTTTSIPEPVISPVQVAVGVPLTPSQEGQIISDAEEQEEEEIVRSPATISLGQLSAEFDKDKATTTTTSAVVEGVKAIAEVGRQVVASINDDDDDDDEGEDLLLPSSLPTSSQPQPEEVKDTRSRTNLSPPPPPPPPHPLPPFAPTQVSQSSSRLEETAPSSSPFVAQILLNKKSDKSRPEGEGNGEGEVPVIGFQSLSESFIAASSSADPDLSGSILQRGFPNREDLDIEEGGEKIERVVGGRGGGDDSDDDNYQGDQSGDTLMGPTTSTQQNSSNPSLPDPLPTQAYPIITSESMGSNSLTSKIQAELQAATSERGYQYLPDEPTPEFNYSDSLKRKKAGKAVGFGQSSSLMDLPLDTPKKKKRVDPMDVDFSDLDDDDEQKEKETEVADGNQNDMEEIDEGSKDMSMDDSREEEEEEEEEKDDTPRPTGEFTRDMEIDEDEIEDDEEGEKSNISTENKGKGVNRDQMVEDVEDEDEDLSLSAPQVFSSPVVVARTHSQSQSQSQSRSQSPRKETQSFGPQGDTQTQSSLVGGEGEEGEGGERQAFRLSDINIISSSYDDQTQIEIDLPATQVDYDIEAFHSRSNSNPSRNLPPFAYPTTANESDSHNTSKGSLPPLPGRELKRQAAPLVSSDPVAQELSQNQSVGMVPSSISVSETGSASASAPNSIKKSGQKDMTNKNVRSGLGLPSSSSPPPLPAAAAAVATSSNSSSPSIPLAKKISPRSNKKEKARARAEEVVLEPFVIIERKSKKTSSNNNIRSSSPSTASPPPPLRRSPSQQPALKVQIQPFSFYNNTTSTSTTNSNVNSSNEVVPDSKPSRPILSKEMKGKGKLIEKEKVAEEEDIGGDTIIEDSHMMDIDDEDEEVVELEAGGASALEEEEEEEEEKVQPQPKGKVRGRPKKKVFNERISTARASKLSSTSASASKGKGKGKGKGKELADISGSPDELDLLSAGRKSTSKSSAISAAASIVDKLAAVGEEGGVGEAVESFEETNYEELPLPTNTRRRSTSRSVRLSTGSTDSEPSPQPQHRNKPALTSAIKAGKRKAQATDVTVEVEVASKRRRSNPQEVVPPPVPTVARKKTKGKGKAVPVVEVQQQPKKKGGRPTRKSIEVEPEQDESESTNVVAGPSTSRLRFNSMDDVMLANGTRSTEPSFEGQGPRKPKSRLPDTAPFTRIFGMWRDDGWWYPCTILTASSTGLKVTFDDESKATLRWEEIRRCELKRGDYFKYRGDDIETETQAETLNEELRVLRVEIGITGEDREEGTQLEADDIIVGTEPGVALEDQQDVERKQRLTVAAICIPPQHTAQFEDRQLSEEEVAGLRGAEKIQHQDNLVLLPSPIEAKSAPLVINKKKGLFSGIGFLFTKAPPLVKKGSKVPSQVEVSAEKATYTKLLQSQGGTVIEITHLYAVDVEKETRDVTLDFAVDSLKGIHTVLLLADRPSTTTKFLIALALGIPCVSMEFVATSIKEALLLEWKAFTITTGYLPSLKTYAVGGQVKALSKTSFDLASIESSYSTDGLFRGCAFLVIIEPKGKTTVQVANELIVLRNIVSAGGAHRVDFVNNSNRAGLATGYAYVLIDDEHATTPALEQHHGLVNVEWLKQCLIAGRRLSPERAEGVEVDH